MSKVKLIPVLVILILFSTDYYLSKTQEKPRVVYSQNLKLFEIKTYSMEPTLNIGNKVTANLNYYKHNKPQRNDLIVFQFKTRDKPFVKRVVALEEERVEIKNGVVYINEIELSEPYVQKDNSDFPLKIVDKGSVFVLGDNRAHSFDSRDWGFLPISRVIGKIAQE